MNNTQKAWLKALRSGRYRQGKNALSTFDTETGGLTHCCLGVACQVSSLATAVHYGTTIKYRIKRGNNVARHATSSLTSDTDLYQRLNLGKLVETTVDNVKTTIPLQDRLIIMNDDEGASFLEIADFIEAAWQGAYDPT